MKTTLREYKSLSIKLGIIIMAILPVFVICFLSYKISDDILSQEINHALNLFAQKKVQAIDDFIHERISDTYQFSNLPSIKLLLKKKSFLNIKEIKKFFKNFLRETNFNAMYLIDSNKQLIYSSDPEIQSGIDFQALPLNKKFFKQLYDFSTTLLSPAVSFGEQYQTGLNNIYFTSPVFDKGLFKGVLVLSLNHDALNKELLQNIGLSDSTKYIAANIHHQANVIFSSNKKAINFEYKLDNHIRHYLHLATEGFNGIARINNPDSGSHVVVYRYLPQINMGLLMQYASENIYKKSAWIKKRIIFLFFVSILLIIIITLWLLSRMRRIEIRNERLTQKRLPLPLRRENLRKSNFTSLSDKPVILLSLDESLPNSPHISKKSIQLLRQLDAEIQLIVSIYRIDTLYHHNGHYCFLYSQKDILHTQALNFSLALLDIINTFNHEHDCDFSAKISLTAGDVILASLNKTDCTFESWGNALEKVRYLLSFCSPNSIITTPEIVDKLINKDNYSFKPVGEIDYNSTKVETYCFYIPERANASA